MRTAASSLHSSSPTYTHENGTGSRIAQNRTHHTLTITTGSTHENAPVSRKPSAFRVYRRVTNESERSLGRLQAMLLAVCVCVCERLPDTSTAHRQLTTETGWRGEFATSAEISCLARRVRRLKQARARSFAIRVVVVRTCGRRRTRRQSLQRQHARVDE